MAAVSPLLKPVGIAAAAIASFEALAWGILSLLGVLATQTVFETKNLNSVYDRPTLQISSYVAGDKKDETLIFTSVYLAASVVWLIVSSLLLYDFVKNRFRFGFIVSWTTVTFTVCVIDLAATIFFGIEFGARQNDDKTDFVHALPPLVMMLLSARGFVLWLFNVAAAVYLSVAAHKIKMGIDSDKEMQNIAERRMSEAASLYGSMSAERDFYSKPNPAYQPEPLSAWNIQSPTVGDTKRSLFNFPDTTSPARIFPRIGRPVSTPSVPPSPPTYHISAPSTPVIAPLPIPHPDYSPPMSRPVKHEPNMYDAPLRSALKKPPQYGRTIL
ncbi:hypothetical protein L9F63_024402 [Diploptera punctata]|uniref:Uncharacterized protein n=1 Tax=Diploptera punctata TaxID=6984 RepID=A0AAD7ZHB9_DIPPU|nr:hypothetical protein L9F63_024402 [Diploptera punctata]